MICRANGCRTILSRYNTGNRCSIHELPREVSHRVHRKRNGTDIPHDEELTPDDREAYWSGAWAAGSRLEGVETRASLGKGGRVSTSPNGEGP